MGVRGIKQGPRIARIADDKAPTGFKEKHLQVVCQVCLLVIYVGLRWGTDMLCLQEAV